MWSYMYMIQNNISIQLYLYSLFSDERNCVTKTVGNLREDLVTNGGLLKVIDKVLHLKQTNIKWQMIYRV